MTTASDPGFDLRSAGERAQLEAFLDEYRCRLPDRLDGLDEKQARRRIVPSKTTLLGLIKHMTFVENVWFNEAITGTPRNELGPATPDASFTLTNGDNMASIRDAHARTCAGSRERVANLSLDHVLHDRQGKALTVRFLFLQCIREYAHHTGHADIVREMALTS